MSGERDALQHELNELRENLALIRERMSEYVLRTDIPLQLVKEARRTEARIRRLERQIDELRPLEVVRRATKLIVDPVARAVTGEPWKELRQELLTRASKFPLDAYLDTALMEAAADELIGLIHDVRILLAAHRIEPNPGQLAALQRRAAILAGYLIRIYRLQPGEAPELEALAAGQGNHQPAPGA